MDVRSLIAHRSMDLDASGIRRVFRLGAKMTDKVDLSIGRPHFAAPEGIRAAAIAAINRGDNNYSMTEGVPALTGKLREYLAKDLGWSVDLNSLEDGADINRPGVLVTSGTSGALMLTFMALLDPGDEAILADPYFVMYPQLLRLLGVSVRLCDTYPDFRMTAERVERLINPRTKLVLLNSPGNPSGVVASKKECRDLLDLCRAKNVLLVSDEIYDEFTYAGETVSTPIGPRCPSPARLFDGMDDADRSVLLIRGFGKTYGVTGWRLGYAAGPRPLIEEMCKLQQYTSVCAPTPLQHGVAAFDEPGVQREIAAAVQGYEHNRDETVRRLGQAGYRLTRPGGAFYAFPEVPENLGLTSGEFFELCRQRKLLIVPGKEFSKRDTHFRISLATSTENLSRGLAILEQIAADGSRALSGSGAGAQ